MWLLSCSTDLFGGKRIWLRPGSSTLLGRTSGVQSGVRNHYIENGSVSRKHLYLNVAEVESGNSTKLLTKSVVTVVDGSKTGTYINGHRVPKEGKTMRLDQDTYEIKLGTATEVFTLEWRPVVLSFTTGVPKTAKAKGTALTEERAKLEPLDVKVATEYIPNQTTHAIAKKRNTATVLQALLQGKWVIMGSYVGALVEACKQGAVDEHGNPGLSALEADFDGNWPKEEAHICPAAAEQKVQSDEELKPDPRRADLFHGYIFVFIDATQLNTLQPVINAGSGKAVCYEFQNGKSTTEDIVHYVQQLAGKKGSGQVSLSQEPGPGGIVIVRPAQGNQVREDSNLHGLDLALDQRSIEQGEFLDTILTLDTNRLRQPLKRVNDAGVHEWQPTAASSSFPPPPNSTQQSVQVSGSLPSDSQQPLRAEPHADRCEQAMSREEEKPAVSAAPRRRRFITQKRFKGFDDYDESQIIRPASSDPSQRPSRYTSAQRVEADEPSQHPAEAPYGTQKRPAPIEEAEEEETAEQKHERMFPGQAAYKRRKIEALKKGDKPFLVSAPASDPGKVTKEEPVKKAKEGKEVAKDLKARMIAEREAEEERHRKEKEADDAIRHLDSDDIPKVDPVVVEYELPVREQRPATMVSNNPAWNGRPNYKKFRRKGTERPQVDDTLRVLIRLEEVPGKGHGLGDEYWLENGDMYARHRRKERSQSKSQPKSRSKTQSQSNGLDAATASVHDGEGSTRDEVDEDERTAFRRRVERSRHDDEEEIADDAMWDGRASGSTQSTLGTLSQKKAAGKRPATTQLDNGPAKKARPTTLQISDDDDDDDDDDPKAFRRKRR